MAHSSDRLNPTDATLWQIQRDPLLRTTIVGLALLDRQPRWDDLTGVVERAVERLPRLRQRVVDGPLGLGRPHWADAEVDLAHHLTTIEIDDVTDPRALLDIVGRLASDDLDLDRPLWELHLVHGSTSAPAALIFKLSHTLTDGVGGMGLLRIFDDRWVPPPPPDRAPTSSTTARAFEVSSELATLAAHAGLHPLEATSNVLDLVGSAVHLLAPAGPPLSPLMTGRSSRRWTGTSELPLERLRAAAHRAGGTLNDAFVTIAIAALDEYHRQHRQAADGFRVTMPVDIRRRSDEPGGNQWAPARLVLRPTPDAHPFEALQRHRTTIAGAIGEPAIPFIQPIAAAVQQLPDDWTIGIVANMVKGSDLVLTNVPGLREPLTIAGATVTRFYPFAPTGGAAVNIGLVSHLDTACVGFNVDTEAVPDPETLLALFDEHARQFLRRRRAPAVSASAEHPPERDTARSPRPDTESSLRLSALDTTFLRIESPTTPMHLGGLFVINGRALLDPSGRLDIERLRRHVDSRLRATPRLRRRLAEVPLGLGRPVWVEDPDFDIARHVHRRTLAAPGGTNELFEACEHLQMVRLDRRQALFDLTFFDGLDPEVFGPGAIALIDRVHHALLDGVSGMEMVQTIFDPVADTHPADGSDEIDLRYEEPEAGPPSPLRRTADAIVDRLAVPLEVTRASARMLTHPNEAREVAAAVAVSVGNVLGHRAGVSSLTAPVGRHRLLRTTEVSLADVHDIGTRLGASVNDVLLGAVACGLTAVLRSRGEPVSGHIDVLVPVSTRRLGLEAERGNHVAAMIVELPLGSTAESTIERVAVQVEQLRRRGVAQGSERMLDAVDWFPPGVIDMFARGLRHQRRVHLVVTNIRGPAAPLSLLGGEVRTLVPIVPLGPNLTLGLAVVSHAGTLTLAFHADRDRWPDLDLMTQSTHMILQDLTGHAENVDSPTSDRTPTDGRQLSQ